MQNYYEILGITSSADTNQIRKAYREKARKFHPDVNPDGESLEIFKSISEGYTVLMDDKQRKKYDRDLEKFKRKNANKKFEAYRKQQDESRKARATERYYNAQKDDLDAIKSYQTQRRGAGDNNLKSKAHAFSATVKDGFSKVIENAKDIFYERNDTNSSHNRASQRPQATERRTGGSNSKSSPVNKISIIEVSVTMSDVIEGVKKAVDIEEPGGSRRIRVSIPPGVKSGSVVRMRSSHQPEEEIVLVVRVARHPYMQIDNRGLIVDIPISVLEASAGASIKVPTLDEEQILLKVPPGTQSGREFRVRGKGIKVKEERGDIIYRMQIKIPVNENATGITDTTETLARYYQVPVRHEFPKTLKSAAMENENQ